MNLHEILYAELNENGILQEELRELVEKKVTKTINGSVEGEGLISKSAVMDYLKAHGMQPTQKNFEYASRFLQNRLLNVNENGELEMSFTEQEYINHLKEFSDEDMKTLIDICILRKLKEIEQKIASDQLYEYAVESIQDEGGRTNIWRLSELISKYAEQGYQVKSIFTNEIGKNAMSIGGVGVNSTTDQVVIIFERLKTTSK